uniref:Uncharacterized protein n=1 Tax=Anguilla anguilla TaxID=7936 RepID=A0A0E9T6T4_ANGAN
MVGAAPTLARTPVAATAAVPAL